ncbi:Thyroid hormone receptor alpha-A [Folsomia candida]|uniref:Thyroid hormone receptor alpha-A n=1 Tax=Folsomia candida TaxID=158441 RepID=A0A226DGT2_FOLCA|nr:Thyroid hormone receptor alpha-A [Folsomia candida]
MGKKVIQTTGGDRNKSGQRYSKKPRSKCVYDMPCNVCGDKARSHNYGGISCNCCRSFFQHFILHSAKNYENMSLIKNCKFEGNCIIDKASRKKCKTCRFLKCVQIGMDPKWVLSDHERSQKLKQGQNNNNATIKPTASSVCKMTDEEFKIITNLTKYFKKACEQIPYNFPSREKDEVLSSTKLQLLLIGAMSIAIRRFVCFASMIPEFKELSLHDRTNLLRRSVVEMIILRDVVTYDFDKRTWNYTDHESEKYPELDELTSIWTEELIEMCNEIYARIARHSPDESSVMLLIAVVLFSDFGGGEACTEYEDYSTINAAQEHYTALLEKYLKFLHGETKGRQVFPRLLCQLMDVTQASHLHQGVPLDLTDSQVDKMHLHLLKLQKVANPASVVPDNITQPTPREDVNGEKDCCRKRAMFEKLKTSNFPPTENPGLPALIHNFVRNPGEYGIKPYYFERGPHTGVEKAFMRRMPTLVTNPLDSLVADVSRLSISADSGRKRMSL